MVCLETDPSCIEETEQRFGARGESTTVRLSSSRWILPEPDPVAFVVTLVPPER